MQSLDLDNSGFVDYTEFLAAFTANSVYIQENYMKNIFKKLDKNNDGSITMEELNSFFNSEA